MSKNKKSGGEKLTRRILDTPGVSVTNDSVILDGISVPRQVFIDILELCMSMRRVNIEVERLDDFILFLQANKIPSFLIPNRTIKNMIESRPQASTPVKAKSKSINWYTAESDITSDDDG